MTNTKRLIAVALAGTILAGPAHANWRGYGYGPYRGVPYYGGGHHHGSGPWPWIAGTALGLGVLGAILAPPVYVQPPVYAPPPQPVYIPPVQYYQPPPGYPVYVPTPQYPAPTGGYYRW